MKNNLYFLPFLLLLMACPKTTTTLPPSTIGDTVFYFEGKIKGIATRWEAGKNDYYMQTGYKIDVGTSLLQVLGDLHSVKDSANNALSISFQGNSASLDSVLKLQNYPILSPFSATDSATVFFQAQPRAGTNPTYSWNFGDGTTSTLANPSHVFPNPNQTYTVSLFAQSTNSTNCTSLLTQEIVPGSLTCNQSFAYNVAGFERRIQFNSLNNATWYFGDGDSIVAQNPEHFYASKGVFTVCMKPFGCDVLICKNIEVGEMNGCGINFSYQRKPFIPVPLVISYRNASGENFSTSLANQDVNSFFTLSRIDNIAYTNKKVKKLTLSFTCKVQSDKGNVVTLEGQKVVFGVGYP